MRRFRWITVGIAAVFLVAGAAFSFAQPSDNHGADVSAVAKPTEPPKSSDHGTSVREVAKSKASEGNESGSRDSEGRKANHGFFVSAAAQCEDVDDPSTATSPDFTAPEDCSEGSAHGPYVRSVAKSSVGKPDKDAPGEEEGS